MGNLSGLLRDFPDLPHPPVLLYVLYDQSTRQLASQLILMLLLTVDKLKHITK